MKRKIATRLRVGPALRKHELNPTHLIAAAINEDGNIDLPSVRNGYQEPEARVEFSVLASGELAQRLYWATLTPLDGSPAMIIIRGDQEPLDLVFFAECLEHVYRRATPSAFLLSGPQGRSQRRFIAAGEENDRARLRLIRRAFDEHLVGREASRMQDA